LRILIVDDHEPVRREIRSLLAARPDFSVCGEASDGIEATELARRLSPDLILMDMSMPRMNGLEATRIVRGELPQCEVIIISQNDPALVCEQAKSVDARYAIAKTDLPSQLLPIIESLSANGNRANTKNRAEEWFVGGGEMGERIRSFDWSKTPLGPVDRWRSR
jgi:DNA-binding NarL/FixJ family response regulator